MNADSFEVGGHRLGFSPRSRWLIKRGRGQKEIGYARFTLPDYDYIATEEKGGKEEVSWNTLKAAIEAACGTGDFDLRDGVVIVRQVVDDEPTDPHVAGVHVVGDKFDAFATLPRGCKPDGKEVRGKDPVDAVVKALEAGQIQTYGNL